MIYGGGLVDMASFLILDNLCLDEEDILQEDINDKQENRIFIEIGRQGMVRNA